LVVSKKHKSAQELLNLKKNDMFLLKKNAILYKNAEIRIKPLVGNGLAIFLAQVNQSTIKIGYQGKIYYTTFSSIKKIYNPSEYSIE